MQMAPPNYLASTLHRFHSIIPRSMTTFEPWAVVGATPDPEPNSTTIAVLNAGIETLTVAKNTIETTPAKAAFESAIVILTLIRVRVPALLPF